MHVGDDTLALGGHMSWRHATIAMLLGLTACKADPVELVSSVACNTDADCDVASGEEPSCSIAGSGKCDVNRHVCVFQSTCTNDQTCKDNACCSKRAGDGCECNGVKNCNGQCEHRCAAGQTCSRGGCCDSREATPCPGAAGQCGGVYRCNGTCSVSAPELGVTCNRCGGVTTCNGCSTSEPANLGESCNRCEGTWQCDSSCSPGEPGNMGQTCGKCGGTFLCDGRCSKEGLAQTVSDGEIHSRPGCGHSYNIVLGGRTCGERARRVRPEIHKTGGGNAGCNVVGFDGLTWANEICARDPNHSEGNSTIREACDDYFAAGSTPANDDTDCRYIIHVGTSWCDGLVCQASHEVEVCR
jgi:hypothetical protein